MGRDLHVHSHPSGIEHWRHLVEIVALSIAAIWGLYVFVYQEKIKPASEELRLQQTLTVHHELLSSGREYVEVRLAVKNISGVDAWLDGMTINIYGRKLANTSHDRIESALPGITELDRTLVLSQPRLLYSFYDTWEPFGAPTSKRNNLRPGQEFHEVIAFGIKPGEYDIAKVDYLFCVSRSGKTWNARRERQPDASYTFAGVPLTSTEPNCFHQYRGEYFPL